ncbi:HAD family hydrolase [Desulfuromonas carbonis]|uniref:HAD family hydrolase n=1 Tax=Desulfuromonas sp. DDH964 TaxID=1823759 RepID=UPI00078EC394|nr:HAD family hydrolase [Desulfuromonas sp. DDH964]AMV73537.1 Phosphoglycolate phosphatase [Desulfuromonas sp. DDH964]
MEPDRHLSTLRGVLFDLDGTLLQVDMGEFIPAYIGRLGSHFADQVAPDRFARTLRAAIHALLAGEGEGKNNEERLLAILEQQTGLAAAHFFDRFQAFVSDGLAELAPLVRGLPLARTILQRAFDRGLKVAIATNPVFPRAVVAARLAWGGLAEFPFDLVTTIENSRYCKPQPDYFRDVAAEIGLAPEECLMVGNDTSHDLAARQVGMPTFLVDTWLVDRNNGHFACDFRGGHPDLFRFLGRLGASRRMN